MDQAGDILLVGKTGGGVHLIMELGGGLFDGLVDHRAVVVLEVLHKKQGVVPLLLGLDLVPVGKATQALLGVKVGKMEVQIGGVKLLVHLGV